MQTVDVHVQRDHLERLAASRSPVASVAELIWNGLDADATLISVLFDRNDLGGIDVVTVEDNGHGLPYDNVAKAFSSLGGSWKKDRSKTAGGRILHGKQGKGRFQAFALGSRALWTSRCSARGPVTEYTIQGDRLRMDRFEVDDPQPSTHTSPGMVVRVNGVDRPVASLDGNKARQTLNEEFALYLRQYSAVKIMYDGQPLDPATVEQRVADYSVRGVRLKDGTEAGGELTIVEWSVSTDRALFLCDEDGFAFSKVPAGIQAPGFVFTAYLKSRLLRELNEKGDLQLEELQPDLKQLLDAAREKMREHFRRRAAEEARGLVEQWRKEEVYPYPGTPKGPIEEAERQVFDVMALNVHEYLPDFAESSKENRRMSFRLLRTALETSPDAVQSIFRDVLNLPAEKQKELAELLERTSLEAIISASKVVADRLDFLQGLNMLVFDTEVKKRTLERRHLHKIVAEHTWLFGEQFNLTVSDRDLTSVLRRHLDLTERELFDEMPVVREDGSEGIVDLMLSRVVRQAGAKTNEHLIVELKRPTVVIDSAETAQVKRYAEAIVNDERFRDTGTRWEFWVLGNAVSRTTELEMSQSDRAHGLLLQADERGLRIWVKTWAQIIEDSRARLSFFQERLRYGADENSGLDYLRRMHAKYLPPGLAEESPKPGA